LFTILVIIQLITDVSIPVVKPVTILMKRQVPLTYCFMLESAKPAEISLGGAFGPNMVEGVKVNSKNEKVGEHDIYTILEGSDRRYKLGTCQLRASLRVFGH
jgi:hypothetical protein